MPVTEAAQEAKAGYYAEAAEECFMRLLDAYTAEGRNVGSSTASTYAPKVFDADRRSKGIGKDALRNAMNALFERGEIINEEFGPPSHTDASGSFGRHDETQINSEERLSYLI